MPKTKVTKKKERLPDPKLQRMMNDLKHRQNFHDDWYFECIETICNHQMYQLLYINLLQSGSIVLVYIVLIYDTVNINCNIIISHTLSSGCIFFTLFSFDIKYLLLN